MYYIQLRYNWNYAGEKTFVYSWQENIAPTCTLDASRTRIISWERVQFRWTTENASTVTFTDHNSGVTDEVRHNWDKILSPSQSGIFSILASNTAASVTCELRIIVEEEEQIEAKITTVEINRQPIIFWTASPNDMLTLEVFKDSVMNDFGTIRHEKVYESSEFNARHNGNWEYTIRDNVFEDSQRYSVVLRRNWTYASETTFMYHILDVPFQEREEDTLDENFQEHHVNNTGNENYSLHLSESDTRLANLVLDAVILHIYTNSVNNLDRLNQIDQIQWNLTNLSSHERFWDISMYLINMLDWYR